MKLGQVWIPLADIPGSLVGNWIVYENMFILHESQWLSWSLDLQRTVAHWLGRRLGRVHGPPGLCPLFWATWYWWFISSSDTLSTLYQLFFLSPLLGLLLFFLLLVFPWTRCSYSPVLFLHNFITVSYFACHLLDGNFQTDLSSLLLICNSRPKSSNILIPNG